MKWNAPPGNDMEYCSCQLIQAPTATAVLAHDVYNVIVNSASQKALRYNLVRLDFCIKG